MSAEPIDAGCLDPADQELERSLAGLTPRRSAGSGSSALVESALFEAGRRAGSAQARSSARHQLFVWRSAAAVLLVAACVAGWAGRNRALDGVNVATGPTLPATANPSNRNAVAIPPSTSPSAFESTIATGVSEESKLRPDSLLAMRTSVLERGVDALPPAVGGAGSGRVPRAFDIR